MKNKNKEIAVLLTCHNRKSKTLACLDSFFLADKPSGYTFEVFLVDDGSTDGTSAAIKEAYPEVNIYHGNGDLFWAGGMRMAWKQALQKKQYDAYLLLNDDVVLNKDFLSHLLTTERYSLKERGKKGIYSGATTDSHHTVTYGGEKITMNHFVVKRQLLKPTEIPQPIDLTNANILWVSKEAVDKIGILSDRYTHGIADFDYSLRAVANDIPVYLAPSTGGICVFDHGKNWKSTSSSLKSRISYLKSPKGLAYKEYLFYVRTHFPLYLPYSFTMLWLKTLFPFIWDKFKK